MELVECGGALLRNVLDGGASHGLILFASEEMRRDLTKSAAHLQTTVEYAGLQAYTISVCPETLKPLVRAVRTFKPDIIVTQDPEHCLSDLDPGRRVAMTLILESIALASRDFALDETPELTAHPISTIYYHTPAKPDCIVDISDVWENKVRAMEELTAQLEFSAQHYAEYYGDVVMEKAVPGWNALNTSLEKGRAAKRVFDQAYYLYHGATGHAHYTFAEAYRREGLYHFTNLIR
jgi:hypothetical protein